MKRKVAEQIVRNPDKYAHHDRVFLNNPVVMQGMGLAPLVVLATSGRNAVMLAVAVLLLLTPSRLLACLLSRLVRGLIYCGSTAVVYFVMYPVLNTLFGVDLLSLGVYLPLLSVEPLLIYRFGRVQERPRKAVSKGLRVTFGYALILLLVGCIREWLATGAVFGIAIGRHAVLPMASMPAGGFIVLGVLCAVWRGIASWRKKDLRTEAGNVVALQKQKEVNHEQ